MSENALTKIAPDVLTTARPLPRLLLAARQIAQRESAFQEVFQRSKAEGWPPERLALEIEDPLQSQLDTNDPQEVVQVARYLADEYQQMGDTMLLISRETGKAIGKITEEDIWQPDPVPREDGSMAVPLPRLRPELEAFLISWHFEKGREERVIKDLTPRLHQTEALKTEGDNRLLPATREGRKHIVDQLRERLPTLLKGDRSGSAGQFLQHFDVLTEAPEKMLYEPLLRCTAMARTSVGVQDSLAMNLLFNRLNHLSLAVGNSWVREMGRTLAVAAKEHFAPEPQEYTTLTDAQAQDISLWVGPPDLVRALGEVLSTRQAVFPVDHAPTLGLLGGTKKIGVIVIDESGYECKGRELHARWEVAAKIEYTLWIDWNQVRAYDLTGLPQFATATVVH